jgi:hypothetical protein
MKRSLPLALAALALALSPAHADSIFVPFATQQQTAGVTFRTEVAVANPSRQPLAFEVRFHATGEDGSRATPPLTRSIAAGSTLVLANLAPAGKQGMIEISGAPELAVTARLIASRKGLTATSAVVPAVTAADALAAGDTAQVQGLLKSRRAVSRVGLINLAETAAACTVQAYRADGTALGAESRATLPPLSQLLIPDLATVAGTAEVAEIRAQATCDQAFFAYAVRYRPDGSETVFVSPSGRLSEGIARGEDATADGSEAADVAYPEAQYPEAEAAAATAPAKVEPLLNGGEGFRVPGIFLDARPGDTVRAYELPAPDNVRYSRVRLEWDLHVSRWQTPVFHGVASLRRTGRKRADRVLYSGLLVRPDRKLTIVDLGDERMIRQAAPWAAGKDYHFAMTYDFAARKVTFQMWRDGALVQTASSRINGAELRNLPDKRMLVDFGMSGIADSAYFPPAAGWQYKNLVVRMER